MKVIELNLSKNNTTSEMPELTLAIGYFDGVHRGHKEVLNVARKYAEENAMKLSVMTFKPHPKSVLSNDNSVVCELTSLDRKLEIFNDIGADFAFVVEFTTELASLSPLEFVERFLIQNNVKHVVTGFDFTFGQNGSSRACDIPVLSEGQIGFTVVSEVSEKNSKVSSSLIRGLVSNGDIEKANKLLDGIYSVSGEVVHGEKRGRTIGFPTANVEPNFSCVTPSTGVYAVKLNVDGKLIPGVCSIGFKPTFHDGISVPVIEAHLFDFNQDIYGKTVTVMFYKKIRDEVKFNGIDELVAQIKLDEKTVRAFFGV